MQTQRRLTWENVLHALRESRYALTNKQLAEELHCRTDRVSNLTLIMFESGEIQRYPLPYQPNKVYYYIERKLESGE